MMWKLFCRNPIVNRYGINLYPINYIKSGQDIAGGQYTSCCLLGKKIVCLSDMKTLKLLKNDFLTNNFLSFPSRFLQKSVNSTF